SLTFTPDNWDTYQTVTLAASEDSDADNGQATIRISASGVSDKDITATEQDDDALNGSILLNLSATAGTSGNNIDVLVEISNNNNQISTFGFEFIYDDSFFNFNGIDAGSLTPDWQINSSNPNSGTIDLTGFGGTTISSSSSGSIVKIMLQVKCLSFTSDTKSQIKIENYTDDLEDEFSPEPCTEEFTFKPCSVLGDVNDDGSVTPGDAQSAFEIFLGRLTPDFCQQSTSDADCNENTTPGDAQDIFEHFLGRITLPQCCADYTGSTALVALDPFRDEKTGLPQLPQKRRLFPLNTIGESGEIVKIPVIMTRPQGVSSFSFEMNYPSDLLEFLGLERSSLTEKFDYIRGTEEVEGSIKIEGEGEIPIAYNTMGSLVVAVFRVREGLDASMPIMLFNLNRDLFGVKPGEGSFLRLKYYKDRPRFLSFGEAAAMPDGTIKVPVQVSSAFNIKSWGMDIEYSQDKMIFVGTQRTELTEDFTALEENEIELGKVRIGGFSLDEIQKKRSGALVELIFSVREEGAWIRMVDLYDDIQNYLIQRKKVYVK
ncbi:MAG: cohesin domain-containing protein, partial [Candidatus Aminicenantes bacterium]